MRFLFPLGNIVLNHSPFLFLLLLLLGTSHSNISDPSLAPQDSSTGNVSSVDVDNIGTRELPAASLAGQLTDACTSDVPLSTSAENSESKNMPLDGVTGESTKPSASGRSGPLGLGGGLQPKVLTNESTVFS